MLSRSKGSGDRLSTRCTELTLRRLPRYRSSTAIPSKWAVLPVLADGRVRASRERPQAKAVAGWTDRSARESSIVYTVAHRSRVARHGLPGASMTVTCLLVAVSGEVWQPAAMPLSEEGFTALVDAGCPTCSDKTLAVEAYVAQRLPLLAGEVFGAPSWGYKGEDLVRGTYRIACTVCKRELFTSTDCPRCAATGGIPRALATENEFPLPVSCTSCGGEQLVLTAYVPAEVVYEGKRAAKARTQTAPEDAGFHAYRAECKQCRSSAVCSAPCPLCGGSAAE
jgi:hypothetical protein